MTEPQTTAARVVARRPGARWWGYTLGFEGYSVDCPTCGPQAAVTWSLDGWHTFLVQCSCSRTPAGWALAVGINPALLDPIDRTDSSRFTDPFATTEAA